MIAAVRRACLLVGYRGAALLFFADLDLVYGASLLDSRSWPRGPQAEASFHVVRDVAPYPLWGLIWIAIGLVCLAQAFTQRDALAFGLAISLKVAWGVCFLGSWLIYDAYRGWLSALVWVSFAAFVALISGWPEPPAAQRRVGR